MAGPYDYTVNIPQPPAQNFLQSLTGIMQLRQMQDQADIAAQQAKFQKEMQPLEMERARAGIAAAKAGTSATQTSQQAAAYQLQQRKDLDAELLGLSSDPSKFTAENLQRLAVRFHSVDPTLLTRAGEMRKNLPDQAKIFGDNIAKNLVLTSVTGDSKAAIKQLDKELEAAKNTPGLQDYVPKIEQLKDNFIKYPDQTVALAAVGQTLFAPDQGKAITDVLSEQAKIGKTKAETKKELALAAKTKQQKQVDEEKRALDLQKEKLQIQELEQKLDEVKPEKPLPSSLIKINQSLEDKAKAFEASSLELKNAADAFNQFSGGKPKSGKINEMIVKAKGLLFSQPEIPIRNELQRVLNLGGLGAEAQAQGGAVRSNAMVNLATKYIPDVWKNPEAAMEKAQVTAEVKDRMAKVFRAEAEWNAQFRGKQNAPDDADVAGISVQKGQSKSNFITALTASLFPKDEVPNTPALDALIGAKSPPKAAPSAPTSNLGRPVSTGTLPVAPAGGVFTIDGVEIKVAPRNK